MISVQILERWFFCSFCEKYFLKCCISGENSCFLRESSLKSPLHQINVKIFLRIEIGLKFVGNIENEQTFVSSNFQENQALCDSDRLKVVSCNLCKLKKGRNNPKKVSRTVPTFLILSLTSA